MPLTKPVSLICPAILFLVIERAARCIGRIRTGGALNPLLQDFRYAHAA
jgi:hypothetical protein